MFVKNFNFRNTTMKALKNNLSTFDVFLSLN